MELNVIKKTIVKQQNKKYKKDFMKIVNMNINMVILT